MGHFFAVINLKTPVTNPQGEIVGHKQNEIRRAFPMDTPMEDVREWAYTQGAQGTTILFETKT